MPSRKERTSEDRLWAVAVVLGFVSLVLFVGMVLLRISWNHDVETLGGQITNLQADIRQDLAKADAQKADANQGRGQICQQVHDSGQKVLPICYRDDVKVHWDPNAPIVVATKEQLAEVADRNARIACSTNAAATGVVSDDCRQFLWPTTTTTSPP